MQDLVLSDKDSFAIEIDYWREKLQGVAQLHLNADLTRTNDRNADKAVTEFLIDSEKSEQLVRLNYELDVDLFTVLLSAFKVLLYRYSNQEDICVLSPVIVTEQLNSPDPHSNILAFRSSLNGEVKFVDLIKQVNATLLEARKHQKAPFEKIVEAITAEKNENSLFNVMFVFLNDDETDPILEQPSKYDLTFILKETSSGILLKIEYAADLYLEGTIKRMAGHYHQLLDSIIKDPHKSIGALPILTPTEMHDVLVKFNNTLSTYPAKKTIVNLFEEQVLKTPENIALRQQSLTLTYREVNERANQLARYLVDHGVNKGDNVGLLVARGFDMIIGMYAIMKAGGAYVPIDPEYPIERQEYILHNSSVTKVVADGNYSLESLTPANQFIKINTLELISFATHNLGVKVDSKQLAYTIYTSGSTGRPKGVMIEHHSAVNLILWVNTEFNIGSDDRLLFITSMCFDLSVYDIFGMLASGGSIVIVEQHELMDVPKLKDMLIKHNITFWDSVPTTMDYLVRELEAEDNEYLQKNLRLVFMSGDWIPVSLPGRIKKYFSNAQVISLGGATEGTIWSNYYPIEKVDSNWSSIPYGKPINNNFFYILNEQLQPVPIGIPGELYIGGVGVARGYANEKEKTDYSFVEDPFSDRAGGRMYRTGDLGRMLPNLNMEFIGRRDDQVKIRGYRIELGEIESVLRQSEFIKQAVVLARADKDGKKRLVSYIVGKDNYDRELVISYLKSKLPDYMVPALWLELNDLPLTSNGKIDKKALPDFDAEEQLKEQYAEPVTESEKVLVEIWKEVLKLKTVGANDNFFDIGGHSLLAVQIMTKIEKKTSKKFQIAILFKYPTVRSLNAFIQKDNKEPTWKSLVAIKASGNNMPFYIVHGAGLNVLNFNSLALHLHPEQPVYGLQAKGLDGEEDPMDSITDIAKFYVSELLEHNPSGPYAIGGYSIGGFIAVEMARQLEKMGKKVKMLAIFDTDADNAAATKKWHEILYKKIKRYMPKFLGGTQSLSRQLYIVAQRQVAGFTDKLGVTKKAKSKDYYQLLDNIQAKHDYALVNYKLTPFNTPVYLFNAKTYVHYNDDAEYYGWKKFALNITDRCLVPGNHLTMLQPPNVEEFASILQKALDNC
ncbi:MAG: amino acid adenylation protein [Mucilaginibacter sp.]|nr:amino acid adenylation protein [Mucilaginibacter sp.]